MTSPNGFGVGGQRLWDAITTDHPDLTATQLVQLEEACRAKDRLDRLDLLLSGDTNTWVSVMHNARTEDYELKIDAALSQANSTANLMKQLIAALRLPDPVTGKKPQYRGPRGAVAPQQPGGKVSSIERARARQQQSG